jgi:hypothetical protein
LNLKEKLKRKIKFTKESKIKIKRMNTRFEKIKNKIMNPMMKLKTN